MLLPSVFCGFAASPAAVCGVEEATGIWFLLSATALEPGLITVLMLGALVVEGGRVGTANGDF